MATQRWTLKARLIACFTCLLILLILTNAYALSRIVALHRNAVHVADEGLHPVEVLGHVNESVWAIQSDLARLALFPDQRDVTLTALERHLRDVDAALQALREDSAADRWLDQQLYDRWTAYEDAVQSVMAQSSTGQEEAALRRLQDGGDLAEAAEALIAVADAALAERQQAAEQLILEGKAAYRHAIFIFSAVNILAILLAAALGASTYRSIAKPLGRLTQIAESLSRGELTSTSDLEIAEVDVRRADEIGRTTRAFNALAQRFVEIARIAQHVAAGDLSLQVTPQSDVDQVGAAFARMLHQLRIMVAELQESASQVAASSQELGAAAEQASQATRQVSATVQEIAGSNAQSASALNQAATQMDQLAQAIDGIARGAQEQAEAAERAAAVVARVTAAIEEIDRAATEYARTSADALHTAQSGARTVEEAIASMTSIQQATKTVGGKVSQMDQAASEIGNIIQAIEDIADQTNLLALNAAIEAARAGEQGRGFAVVADEVRKLAERAARSTKEIAQFIENVQTSAQEAVIAVRESMDEVNRGTERAQRARDALHAIEAATQRMASQIEGIARSARQISEASDELNQAVESVSAVIEENTAATEQMAASSQEVHEAINTVAAAGEQASAATQEVAAAAEEMSAQAEEVSASASGLADLAQQLRALANQFILHETTLEEELAVLDTFRQAHLKWLERAEAMIAGDEIIHAEQLTSHTDCALGRWYRGRGQLRWGHLPEFAAVDAPHERIHALLKATVTAHNTGDHRRAKALLQEMREASRAVVAALDALAARISAEMTGDGTTRRHKAMAETSAEAHYSWEDHREAEFLPTNGTTNVTRGTRFL
ncbi:MAG: hypothetical protein Kow0047_32090 [Anaerolineae bacterium]